MEKRKGARSTKDIPVEILEQLNRGEIPSANLTEWLAMDQKKVLQTVLEQLNKPAYIQPTVEAIANLPKQTVNTINQCIGFTLFTLAKEDDNTLLFEQLKSHPSDLVRCWATYFIGYDDALSLHAKLEAIRYFAADDHFGVREIGWMAVRSDIIANLIESIAVLTSWTKDENAYVRRFATEATRPRGVWCQHIEQLKLNPALGLPLVEALHRDTSKYVCDSVGNWLNDAAKSDPEFVTALCAKWENEQASKETKYIIKKALRSL